MGEKVRAHVYISGTVQGVFFRSNTRAKALELGISGWVRNLRDGRVEAVFEGEKEDIDRILDWCRRGPPLAGVDHVEAFWEPYTGDFRDFSIRYS